MHAVGIIGGSGYTGGELIRLLLRHPSVELRAVASRRLAGQPLASSFSWLSGLSSENFVTLGEIVADERIELVFTALDHTESTPVTATLLAAGKKVVDLSADFRFRDPAVYELWYRTPHARPDLLPQAVYGLPEINRAALATASLCANPGCYVTASVLALLPLARLGMLPPRGVVVDAKSGVSGAGRRPKDHTVFTECNEGLRAYAVGTHRHQPEIEEQLSAAAGSTVRVLFAPHLLPANRGILATVYVPGTPPLDAIRPLYEDQYRGEPFVHLAPAATLPGIQDVRGSNHCRIGLTEDRERGFLVVVAVLDNLVKGASGQAVQNMNLMLGLPEESGLGQLPLAP